MNTSMNSWLVRIVFFSFALMALANSACHKSNSTNSPSAELSKLATTEEVAEQSRLDWNIKTLVAAYEQAGHKNSRWDESAKHALAEFARNRAAIPGTQSDIISTNVAAAVQAGCDDPMVNYLFIRYAMDETNSKAAFSEVFFKAALALEASSYSPMRKFFACFRATQQYGEANNWPTNWPAERKAMYHRMIDHLSGAVEDASTPAEEIYDACHVFLNSEERNKVDYPKYWASMEPLVFKYWPKAATSWLLKGEANIRLAWQARGDGYANTVTEQGWKETGQHLAIAQDALEHAWKINPHDVRIPLNMLRVALGQGGGRSHMETWFDRAMAVDTNCYDACQKKLYYLEPKWYGSDEEQIAFGRECIRSTNWGGHVPLAMLDAHLYINGRLSGLEKTNYWKNPAVWQDLHPAFDRFFELNPDSAGWHHDYAHYAFLCGQWKEFLHQTTLFSYGTNYIYFGGKDEFEQMLRLADERAKSE